MTVPPAVDFSGRRWVDSRDPARWRQVGEQSFSFHHNLASHPLFEIDRLGSLVEKTVDQSNWMRDFTPEQRRLGRETLRDHLRDSVLDIAASDEWVVLNFVDQADPEYRALYEQVLADIERAAGTEFRQQMTWAGMSIVIQPPGFEAPYHFDHSNTFILQVRGAKNMQVFPNERHVVTEEEIEDYYRHNPLAAKFRSELDGAGTDYLLRPGVGVYNPPLSPRVTRTGDEVSVSISIHYSLPEADARAAVYQANYVLRKLGLRPTPPGRSHRLDKAKRRFIGALSKSRPGSYEEAIFSGVDRLGAPLRMAKKIVRKFRR
ncbi:cupin domain-containing protein [Variovorax robiniae]|uniref:Cupin domain-containing protein n=1 Tax=Variovorax robiniae TaxID=1836199 RepID=A0ABU8X2N6_9BURK